MDEDLRTTLARRASPYGLAVVPETDMHDYTDPRNEAAVERRWHPICEQVGAQILGVRDVPTGPARLELDGIEWTLEPYGSAPRGVSDDTFHRWRALEANAVPFFYFLWGEEQPQRPLYYPLAETRVTRPSAWRQRIAALGERLDPLVIGVIPTAPGRGLWVLIGRWFH